MQFTRVPSGIKLMGIGSLALFSFSILFVGASIAILMWAPWWFALKVFDVPTLDVFRIYYSQAYAVVAPSLLFGGASGFVLSTVLAKKSHASKKAILYTMLSVGAIGLFIASAFIPSVTAISATQTATYSQYQAGTCTYYVQTVTVSSTPQYFAQNCSTGTIDYGYDGAGDPNAGGATGTVATSVISKAFAALPASKVQSIVILSGSFTFTASLSLVSYLYLDLRAANITLGNGVNSQILNAITGQSYVTIVGGFLNGNLAQQTAGGGIWFQNGGSHNSIIGVSLKNTYAQAIGANQNEQDIQILQNRVSWSSYNNVAGRDGIYTGAKNITVSQNVVTNAGDTGIVASDGQVNNAAYICRDVIIDGNTIIEGGAFINNQCQNVKFVHNTLRNVGGQTMIVSDGGGGAKPSKNVLIGWNTFISPGGNNAIEVDDSAAQLQIIGNTIMNYTTAAKSSRGIFTSAAISGAIIQGNVIRFMSGYGIVVTTLTDSTISDNVISDMSFGNGAAADCILLTSTSLRNTVSGNTCYDDQAVKTTRNGIREENSGSDYNLIFNNIVKNIQGVGVVLNPGLATTHSLDGFNLGFNPVAASTYTACVSVCTYTNNDGYSEIFTLLAANGISAWSCNGQSGISIVAAAFSCTVPPGGTMATTWTTTTPTFDKVPLDS